ncbi:MAG: hypothetical protein KJ844_11135, partial [Candidatus Edwardsbacteria bacterium]|nr:hypothetical protein [Candidatus Edwardsbacteria bacterium]
MESKIKIKLGGIEIEYEGSESFLKKELPDLIKIVTELYKSSKTPAPPDGDDDSGEGEKDEGSIKLSTKSIATKLSCASGPDLIIAAAAHLTLVKNTPVF